MTVDSSILVIICPLDSISFSFLLLKVPSGIVYWNKGSRIVNNSDHMYSTSSLVCVLKYIIAQALIQDPDP